MDRTDTFDRAVGALMWATVLLVALFTAWIFGRGSAGLGRVHAGRLEEAVDGGFSRFLLSDATWNLILWSALALIVATIAIALVFQGEREIARVVAKNRAAVLAVLEASRIRIRVRAGAVGRASLRGNS